MADEPQAERRAFTTEGEVLRLREQVDTIRASLYQTNLSAVALQSNMQLLTTHMDAVQRGIEQLQLGFDTRYAPKAAFEIIQKVVFGGVAIVLVAVLTALLAGVLPGQKASPVAPRPAAAGTFDVR